MTIEVAAPAAPISLAEMGDEQLDESIQVLLPSMRDADRTALAVFLVERHNRCRADEAWAWVRDCETLYFLASHTFAASWVCGECGFEYWWHGGILELDIPPFTPVEDLPEDFTCPRCLGGGLADFQAGAREPLWKKYAQGPGWSWAAFAMDTLDMSPGSASARKRTWEVFVEGLGWTVDMLRRAGPGRLGLAVGEMARTLPQGGDPVLAAMLLGTEVPETAAGASLALVEVRQEPSIWHEVWDYIRAKGRARDVAAGRIPLILFRVEEVRGEKGEDRGVAVKAWLDDLPYAVGTFVWEEGLPDDVKGVFKENLLAKLRK